MIFLVYQTEPEMDIKEKCKDNFYRKLYSLPLQFDLTLKRKNVDQQQD
jgi:hypothetical protein